MAKGLRVWAKIYELLKQPQRKFQASLHHHILELCDNSVAIKKDIKKDKKDSYGGWLIVEKIKNCYKNIK